VTQKQYLRLISDDSRIRVEFSTKKGKVAKFTTQYELLINDQWHPVIRYDTAHNFVHIDILYPDGTKTKKELIHEALKEFIDAKQRLNLRDLKGKIEFRTDYDYKRLRKGA